VGETISVVVSDERRRRRPSTSAVLRMLSVRYDGYHEGFFIRPWFGRTGRLTRFFEVADVCSGACSVVSAQWNPYLDSRPTILRKPAHLPKPQKPANRPTIGYVAAHTSHNRVENASQKRMCSGYVKRATGGMIRNI